MLWRYDLGAQRKLHFSRPLPSKWVLHGASACLIAEELKDGDDKTFLEDNKKILEQKKEAPCSRLQPQLLFKDATGCMPYSAKAQLLLKLIFRAL